MKLEIIHVEGRMTFDKSIASKMNMCKISIIVSELIETFNYFEKRERNARTRDNFRGERPPNFLFYR